MEWRGVIVGLLLATLLSGMPLLASPQQRGEAQKPRLSQHGAVSQTINDTVITIAYNRPVARGRELFGALVPWGRIWCPGADEATSITLTTDVVVNGKTLAAGSYTIWANPNPEEWTIIFSNAYPAFHTPYPAGRDALRVTAKPRTGDHMETLSFYFPVVDGKRGELVLHWGTMVVPVELEVP